ncbi:MAG: hypothetical protein JWR27_364 [Aeromicrobium sp.]|nr:hypothetical protein [Aeromicrobium sp.]
MSLPVATRTCRAGALLTLAAALVAAPSAGGIAASAADPTSQVFIVQGVPGSTVDVEVDGDEVETSAAARAVLGPVDLPSGQHTVTFTSADWTVKKSFDASRPSMDIVLHWPADPAKQPETTVFTNDVSAAATGMGRLTVAHTAVVPPADVRVDKKVLFANIANGEFITAEVPPDTYSVDIVPTGGSSPLLGPIDLDVKADALTRVFAIGQPKEGSMDAIVQVLPLGRGGSGSPGMVDAGSAGLVAPGRSDDQREGPQTAVAAVGVLAAAIVGAAIAAVRGARRRV